VPDAVLLLASHPLISPRERVHVYRCRLGNGSGVYPRFLSPRAHEREQAGPHTFRPSLRATDAAEGHQRNPAQQDLSMESLESLLARVRSEDDLVACDLTAGSQRRTS
jgi:hypothetical protein